MAEVNKQVGADILTAFLSKQIFTLLAAIKKVQLDQFLSYRHKIWHNDN